MRINVRAALAAMLFPLLSMGALAGPPVPRKIVAVLDATQNFGNTRRAVSFYEVTTLNAVAGNSLNQSPLFSVWTGYEDAATSNFEDPQAITVNPINGNVYVAAFDSNNEYPVPNPGDTPGTPDAAGDGTGDFDLYQINYQAVLNDFVSNSRPRGTMYAPSVGPDGILNPQHPDHIMTTVNLAGIAPKIGEVARTQNIDAGDTPFFDYDIEFRNSASMVFLDNQVGDDGVAGGPKDDPALDHEIRAWVRTSKTPGLANYVPRDVVGPLGPGADGFDEGGNGGFDNGTTQSWESYQLGKVVRDFDAGTGLPVGRSEPVDIAYVRDRITNVEGVWLLESDGGGDDLSFFQVNNLTGTAGNAYSTIDGLGTSRGTDQDPEFDPNTNDGNGDWIAVQQGRLLAGESGFFDLVPGGETGNGGNPAGEPSVLRYNVSQYNAGNVVTVAADGWDDLDEVDGLGPIGSDRAGDLIDPPTQLEGPLGSLLNPRTGGAGLNRDDDTNVTDGRFATILQGGIRVDLNGDGDVVDTVNGQPEVTGPALFMFDIDSGALPGLVGDLYVVDMKSGKIVYEELNAANNFFERHGIRGFTRGDSDGDGDVDATDIDQFAEASAQQGAAALVQEDHDLTGDMGFNFVIGSANSDSDELIHDILGTEYGDANLDGMVNFLDLSGLSGGYGNDAGWAGGDFNGDDTVNFLDLSTLSGKFGFTNMPGPVPLGGTAGVASIPEPSMGVFTLMAGLGLLARRRRVR